MHIDEIVGTEYFEREGKPRLDRCFAGEEEVIRADWYATPRGRRYRVTTYSLLRPDSQGGGAALLVARDFTEYAQASEALRKAQTELAHVNRVATMGQLTASIAHEVNQPIAAAVTNASAGLRWLAAQPPDLKEVRDSFEGIIKASNQASEVVSRIRGLIKKVPEQKAPLDVNEAILETIALTRSEMQQHGILLKTELANDVPQILGDRVQLQQVILNLIMNAIEAMSETSQGPHERDQSRTARIAGPLGNRRAGRRNGHRPRLGPRIQTREPEPPFRSVLHDQTGWHGHGAVNLSFDHRSARRTIVGNREHPPGRGLSVHPASRRCILNRCPHSFQNVSH